MEIPRREKSEGSVCLAGEVDRKETPGCDQGRLRSQSAMCGAAEIR